MIRTIGFLITTISYLLVIDVKVILRRVFWRADVEPWLNRHTVTHARMVLALSRLFLKLKHRDETPPELKAALPGQFIILTNHQSYLDIIITYLSFRGAQVRFVAKKSLGRLFPGVAQTLRYQRHALIDQAGNARANFGIITQYAKRCKAQGYCPAIFPEGTRSRDGELGVFQAAGFRMILDNAPLPIVVMAMDGAWKMATLKDYFAKGSKHTRAKILAVLPMPTSKDETRDTLAKARELIQSQLDYWRRGA